MSSKWLHILILLSVLIIPLLSTNVHLVKAEEQEAALAILAAEESIKKAYLMVADAERVEGNVSQLVTRLNIALDDLSTGTRAFKSGNYKLALDLAENAVKLGDVVANDAVLLKHNVGYKEEITFRNYLILTFMTVYIITLFGFLGWILFKTRYLRMMRRMRPEVVTNEP